MFNPFVYLDLQVESLRFFCTVEWYCYCGIVNQSKVLEFTVKEEEPWQLLVVRKLLKESPRIMPLNDKIGLRQIQCSD